MKGSPKLIRLSIELEFICVKFNKLVSYDEFAMNFVVRSIRPIFLLVVIFIFETRSILVEKSEKSPPYFVQQPTTEEILFYVQRQTNDSSTERRFEIPCEAKGIPEPGYFWTKNGQLFNWTFEGDRISQEPGKGTLTVGSPKASDEGQYQCFAKNIWGIATSNSVFARRIELGSFRNESPVDKKATEGQPYNLSCQAPNVYPKPNIDWVIQENDGKIVGIKNPRIAVDPEGTLWFSSIVPEDAVEDAIYLCAVTSPNITKDIKIGGKVTLQVEQAGPIKENETAPVRLYTSKNEETAIHDERINLYCIFGGNPLPNITWKKNGKLLTFRNSTSSKIIEIKRAITSDEGNYTCEASNGHGDPISHTIDLKVLVKPHFVKKPGSFIVHAGESVAFHCQATGNPQPEIIWTHNGKPLSEAPLNPRRTISSNSIVIEGLWKNDTGNYGCNATNSAGYVYQDAFVNVLDAENRIAKPSTTESSDLPVAKITLIVLIISGVVIIVLILVFFKKLLVNQRKKYILHKQRIDNRRPEYLEDPSIQEHTQPLNDGTPVDPTYVRFVFPYQMDLARS